MSVRSSLPRGAISIVSCCAQERGKLHGNSLEDGAPVYVPQPRLLREYFRHCLDCGEEREKRVVPVIMGKYTSRPKPHNEAWAILPPDSTVRDAHFAPYLGVPELVMCRILGGLKKPTGYILESSHIKGQQIYVSPTQIPPEIASTDSVKYQAVIIALSRDPHHLPRANILRNSLDCPEGFEQNTEFLKTLCDLELPLWWEL